jgi:hypothetical protein
MTRSLKPKLSPSEIQRIAAKVGEWKATHPESQGYQAKAANEPGNS